MEPKLTSDLEKDVIVSYQRGGKKVQVDTFCFFNWMYFYFRKEFFSIATDWYANVLLISFNFRKIKRSTLWFLWKNVRNVLTKKCKRPEWLSYGNPWITSKKQSGNMSQLKNSLVRPKKTRRICYIYLEHVEHLFLLILYSTHIYLERKKELLLIKYMRLRKRKCEWVGANVKFSTP